MKPIAFFDDHLVFLWYSALQSPPVQQSFAAVTGHISGDSTNSAKPVTGSSRHQCNNKERHAEQNHKTKVHCMKIQLAR